MNFSSALKPIRRPRKSDVLYSRLKDLALQLGSEQRLPTIVELCSRLDVAKVTLDVALRRLEAEQIIVRRPGHGIFVSPLVAQKTIAVVFLGDIFSATFSPFWSILLESIRQQATEHRHRLLAYLDIDKRRDGLGGHEQLIEDLKAQRIHGILILSLPSLDGEIQLLSSYGVPVVVFGERPSYWSVTHDRLLAFTLAARELVSRGCRRVALLRQVHKTDGQALNCAMQAAGYDGDPLLNLSALWADQSSTDRTYEQLARDLAQRLIDARATTPLPDGLVSLDDTMTRGVIRALEGAGLRPGRDIQIATAANKGSPVLASDAANLILLEYDPAASAKAALDMLQQLMNGGKPPLNTVLIAPVTKAIPR